MGTGNLYKRIIEYLIDREYHCRFALRHNPFCDMLNCDLICGCYY